MARKNTVRKRSKYSGRKYKRYKKGYWRQYKRQRRGRFIRVIGRMKCKIANRPEPYKMHPNGTRGRPPIPPKTIVISLLIKQLFCLSYIDTESLLLWICGNIELLGGKVPDANTIQEHVKDIPEDYLMAMLEESVQALADDEVTVVIDASGLALNQYGRWLNIRNGKKKVKRKFIKFHIGIDLKTNTILVGLCSKGWKHDHPFGLKLMKRLKQSLRKSMVKLKDSLQDSGYLSRDMANAVAKAGGIPRIKIKKNTTARAKGSVHWKKMVSAQKEKPDIFMMVYCYRVVIEGIISAIKKFFGTTIPSKKRHNQNVDVLSRLVLWNYMQVPGGDF